MQRSVSIFLRLVGPGGSTAYSHISLVLLFWLWLWLWSWATEQYHYYYALCQASILHSQHLLSPSMLRGYRKVNNIKVALTFSLTSPTCMGSLHIQI